MSCTPRRVLIAFVDALGPAQVSLFGRTVSELPHRASLRGFFGYTSGALPTLLTGANARVHGRMCTFRHLREGDVSLLAPLRWLGVLPGVLHERPAVRRSAARALKAWKRLDGYLDLYRVPPSLFPTLDIAERDDLFMARQIGEATSFLEEARARGLSVYASPWQEDCAARERSTRRILASVRPDLTFLYAPELDGVLHRTGNRSREAHLVAARIGEHIAEARRLLAGDGSDVVTLVVGDHGMADVTSSVDPRDLLRGARLTATTIDSTMVRISGPEDELERVHRALLRSEIRGRFLGREELAVRGVPIAPADYGEAIVVLDEGCVFAPSHVGGVPRGMHGYDVHSEAANVALLSSDPIPSRCRRLEDVASLVRAHLALGANAASETG